MRRPDKRHPTFPVLFHPNDVARRTALALALTIVDVFHQLPSLLPGPVLDHLVLFLGPFADDYFPALFGAFANDDLTACRLRLALQT